MTRNHQGWRPHAYSFRLRRLYAQDIINNYIIMTKEIEEIIKTTLQYEGFYVYNKHDQGSETYRGISRKYHPKWEGWAVVDKVKPLKYNERIPQLEGLVHEFYYKNFFKLGNCDLLLSKHFGLAGIYYDYCVHSGFKNAGKGLQTALNNQLPIKTKLVVDGIVGRKTLEIIDETEFDWNKLATDLLEYRRNYLKKVAQQKSNIVFFQGWMNRIDMLKKKYLCQQ